MQVLLIKPPNRGFLHQQERHFPIGLAYLAAVLQKAGHQTTVFDSLAYSEDNHLIHEFLSETEKQKIDKHPRWSHLIHWGANWDRIANAIREAKPDVVGVSCMFSCYYLSGDRVAEIVKSISPGIPVVMGGPHATSMPDTALSNPAADAISMGEAEDTIVPLMERLVAREPLDGLEGAGYRCGPWCSCKQKGSNGNHLSAKSWWRQDLDELPLPHLSGVEWHRYGNTTTLITSRGCPFSCTFCSVHATVGKKFRARVPRLVVDEIEWYSKQYGVHSFNIEDDNFTFDADRVKEICKEILQRNLKVRLRLPNGITSLKVSEELVELMVSAGFEHLFIGLESTDSQILKDIAKGFTSFEKVEEASAKLRVAGIHPIGSLIVGLPGQDIHSVAVDAVRLRLRNILVSVNAFYPVPGAPDYQRALTTGLITTETDPALLEGPAFNNAFRMSGSEVYWSWIAVTVLNYVSQIVFPGRKLLHQNRSLNSRTLVQSLIATLEFWHEHRRHIRVPRVIWREFLGATTMMLPNVFRLKAGEKFSLGQSSCFCGQHRIAQKSDTTPVCAMVADMLTMALLLVSEQAISFQESQCSMQGFSHCTFEAKAVPPPVEAIHVAQIFERCMDELTLPAPVRTVPLPT